MRVHDPGVVLLCLTRNFGENVFAQCSFIGHFGISWGGAGESGGEKCARRSVSRVLSPRTDARGMAIHLGRPLPDASRDRPGRRRENPPRRYPPRTGNPACRPYLVLLPVGFTVPPPSPGARCALTAPFHPYRQAVTRRFAAPAGGLLSVALSLGSPPPGVTRHRVSVEPGLSSPQALSGIWRAAIQPSDILKVKPLDRGVKSCRKLQPSTKARPVGGQPRATGADRADRQDIAFEKPPTPPRNPMCHNRIRAT